MDALLGRSRTDHWTSGCDPALQRYRYQDSNIGRFTSMDALAGDPTEPLSLHKYLYANANPVSGIDPSGKITLTECVVTGAIIGGLTGMIYGAYRGAKEAGTFWSWKTLEYAAVLAWWPGQQWVLSLDWLCTVLQLASEHWLSCSDKAAGSTI